MKKRLLTLVCILLCGCLCACGINIRALDQKETYPDFPGSLAMIYSSMEQLQLDADIIAEVTVDEQTVEPLNGFPQTHSRACIKTLLKGDASAGDLLTVVEEGCNTKEQSVTVGVPPMEQGKSYVLFLTEHNDKYYILGAFQGKFIVKEGYVFQQSTKEVKMKEYSPVTIEEFRTMFS